jgi:hypothetical protein
MNDALESREGDGGMVVMKMMVVGVRGSGRTYRRTVHDAGEHRWNDKCWNFGLRRL